VVLIPQGWLCLSHLELQEWLRPQCNRAHMQNVQTLLGQEWLCPQWNRLMSIIAVAYFKAVQTEWGLRVEGKFNLRHHQ
jgi:hypothetical protein